MPEQHPPDNREPGDSGTPESRPSDTGNLPDRGPLPSPHPLSGPNLSAEQRRLAAGGALIYAFFLIVVPFLEIAVLCILITPYMPELDNPGATVSWQPKVLICLSLPLPMLTILLSTYVYERFMLRHGLKSREDRNRPWASYDGLREARERKREAQGLGRSPFGKYGAAQLARRRENVRKATLSLAFATVLFGMGLGVEMIPSVVSPHVQHVVALSLKWFAAVMFFPFLWFRWRR